MCFTDKNKMYGLQTDEATMFRTDNWNKVDITTFLFVKHMVTKKYIIFKLSSNFKINDHC